MKIKDNLSGVVVLNGQEHTNPNPIPTFSGLTCAVEGLERFTHDATVCELASTSSLSDVLFAVRQERNRQDAKWGEQNHPDFYQVVDPATGINHGDLPLDQRFTYYGIPTEEDAKSDCESTFKRGKGNWGHILIEEISESFGTTNKLDLETELIQSAAVIVAWVQKLRRERGL